MNPRSNLVADGSSCLGGFKMEIPEVVTTPRGPGLSVPGPHLFPSKLYNLACLPVM